jgi:biofilm PGA synthesis N-glycosyltransferase PgaC
MDEMDERLLIVSPVRNEAAHIERVASGLAAQTHPPERWVVVDDGSEDETPQILRRLERELDFLHVVSTPAGYTREAADRLAVAAAPRAFNYGLRAIGPTELAGFTHIGKLDGDVELRPDYYRSILDRFDDRPALGIAGGVILERSDGEWQPTPCATSHVRGALKLYSRECFTAIGGLQERLGWDGIDQVLAGMHGFETRSFNGAEALHHRHTGSADGRLRGHVRWGEAHWILHHGALWTLVRAGKEARKRPRGASGVAYLYGYARAAARRVPRVEIEGYGRFVRAEQRRRMFGRLQRDARAASVAPRSG